eukprot:scaffold24830_cov32-Tisochrysis_lutea.AAC.3
MQPAWWAAASERQYLALAVLKVAKAVEEMSDDAVARNHGVGEDGILVVLARDLEGPHGLYATGKFRGLSESAWDAGAPPGWSSQQVKNQG